MCDIDINAFEDFDFRAYFKKQREERKAQELKLKLANAQVIEKIVCRTMKITSEEIRMKTNAREITEKRFVAMVLINEIARLGPTRTGNYFGFDHASVIHGGKVVGNLLETNREFNAIYKGIERRVKKQLKIIHLSSKITCK